MAELIRKHGNLLQLPISSPEFALALDQADELKDFCHRFSRPKRFQNSSQWPGLPDPIYLCANSLGLMPHRANALINEELSKWGSIGVEGHFHGERPWTTVEDKIIPSMAKIVGAMPSEVVIMNSLTVNLHLMMIAFYKPTEKRFKIVVEDGFFCSDSHAVRSQLQLHGLNPNQALIKIAPRPNEGCLRTEDIVKKLLEHGSSIARVLFPGIQYYTGQLFDIPAITEAGHRVGAIVGWDLAHAVGNVTLCLHDWGLDFACWCTYKYLNSGPGAVGGAFVHENHHHADRRIAGLNGLDGWWGQTNESKFEMGELHDPTIGARGFALSTAPMLSLMCLLASLEIFEEATMERIVTKQRLLTGYLEALLSEDYFKKHIQIVTPAEVNARGSQLSLKFDPSCPVRGIHNRLKALGVICDVREPDVMRIGPAPLYNAFAEMLTFANLLRQALRSFDEF
ncbi:unnamed protein product [Calypogeia fissa]